MEFQACVAKISQTAKLMYVLTDSGVRFPVAFDKIPGYDGSVGSLATFDPRGFARGTRLGIEVDACWKVVRVFPLVEA